MTETRQEIDWPQLMRTLKVPTDPMQDVIMEHPARHVINRRARRTGKSLTAAKRAWRHTIWKPGTRTWVTGPSYELAHKEFQYIVDIGQAICKQGGFPAPKPLRNNPASGDLYVRYPWGAEVWGKSSHRKETLVSEELDCVLLTEAALQEEETWEKYLRPTLSTRKGESIWGYTPDAGGLWLYELELKAAGRPDWHIFTGAAWDSPHFDPKEIEAAKRDLSPDAFDEQYGGEWRFYTGRVHKYQPSVHLVDPFPIPASWPIYSATDFGFRDPTANLWLAKSPSGEGYFIEEYYESEGNTAQHAANLLHLEQRLKIRSAVHIADHHGLGAQLIVDAARAGWKTAPCRSEDVRARRERAETLWSVKAERPEPYHVRELKRPPSQAKNYPGWYLFKGKTPNFVREVSFLRWKQTTRQEGGIGMTQGDDHAVSCAEYIAEYANLGATARRPREKSGQYHYQPVSTMTGY